MATNNSTQQPQAAPPGSDSRTPHHPTPHGFPTGYTNGVSPATGRPLPQAPSSYPPDAMSAPPYPYPGAGGAGGGGSYGALGANGGGHHPYYPNHRGFTPGVPASYPCKYENK